MSVPGGLSMLAFAGKLTGPSALTYAGTGASSGTGTAWANPTRIVANDNSNATSSPAAFGSTATLGGTQYGFAIPSYATIDGIEFTMGIAGTGGGSIITAVHFSKDGTTLSGTNLAASPVSINAFEQPYTFGGPTELAGQTWTPAEINASTFGTLIRCAPGVSASTFSCDYHRVTIYWS